MDKFTSRRRPAWQTKVPAWPFIVAAFAVALAVGVWGSPHVGIVLLGDGTSGGRAVVWLKTLSNVVIPAVIVGVALGATLNALILSPAGRHGAMKWTALLVGACALASAPVAVARGMEADRLGYELRLRDSIHRSRIAAQKAENDYGRRMYLLMQHQGGLDLYALARGDDEKNRKVVAGQKDLLATARAEYDKGQDEARAFLAKNIVGKMDREAVLERFDAARVERKALVDKRFDLQERLISLNEQELDLLTANRGQWRPTPGGATVSSGMLSRLRTIQTARRAAIEAHADVSAKINALDTRTEEGIDRILYAAAKIEE